MFLHINNTMVILLKTASVRVSSIQIMQVRVQNKGKSVWKSRYDGDVSLSTRDQHRVSWVRRSANNAPMYWSEKKLVINCVSFRPFEPPDCILRLVSDEIPGPVI